MSRLAALENTVTELVALPCLGGMNGRTTPQISADNLSNVTIRVRNIAYFYPLSATLYNRL
jgi:hypothetical protein